MGWLIKKYPVEALLRPAVEFNSAFVALLFAVVLYLAPGLILMTPVVAHSAAFLLLILAALRFYQGWRIVHYKRGLKKLPYYSMDGNHVPVSHRRLFLGKGFRWRQKHVERLRDIYREDADQYLSPSALYRFARWLELRFEYTPLLKNIIRLFSWNSFLNPVRPLPPVGGSPEIHAVGMFEGESNITMDLGERVGHTLVLGTTRVGKTRLAELLITQDIRRGDVTIVFDPKGDADLMRRVYGEAVQAGRPVYVFHLGYPDISARYNPVGEFSRITEVAGRIADQLPSEGNSAAFKMFGWKSVIQRKAVVYVGLDCLSDAVVGGAIGASMFADLTSVAGYLYKHGLDYGQATLEDKKTGKAIHNELPKIALHADEFNEIVGDQFIPMLNKAGGAGFQVTAYTQTAADILAGIGNEAKAGQIEGGQLYKIRLPLPKGDDGLPKNLQVMAADMKTSYNAQTPVDWYKAKDFGWYQGGLHD